MVSDYIPDNRRLLLIDLDRTHLNTSHIGCFCKMHRNHTIIGIDFHIDCIRNIKRRYMRHHYRIRDIISDAAGNEEDSEKNI